jgi:hypothetical protein
VVPVVAAPPSGRFRFPPDLGDLDEEEEEAGTSGCGRFTTSGAAMMLNDFVRYVVCTARSVPVPVVPFRSIGGVFRPSSATETETDSGCSIETAELKGINEGRERDKESE